jgi:hypothetical protein
MNIPGREEVTSREFEYDNGNPIPIPIPIPIPTIPSTRRTTFDPDLGLKRLWTFLQVDSDHLATHEVT